MADSPTQQAAKAVAISCAASTTFVKIISFNPFVISPNNLFKMTFSSVGLISDAQMEAFRHTLITVLPDALLGDIEKLDLAPGIVTGLVVNHVEALLDALP
jgi:hypothetical protein